MVGVHFAPAGAVTVHVLLEMVGAPESVMRMADFVAADAMAVAGVNETDAVVEAPLIWETRVMTGPAVMAVKIAE